MDSPLQLAVNKYFCQTSTLAFTRYFFKKNNNEKYIVNTHHRQICQALDKVIKGEIKRLIINIAPRYGKTELAVKNFIAHGLAVNPAARFIHLSYSDTLALDNSERVKDIVKSPAYQQLFPNTKVKPKADAKKLWQTTAGGGVYATATAGQVTGFGAGKVDFAEAKPQANDEANNEEIKESLDFIEQGVGGFAGALIIDDPIKPEEADSPKIRTKINERWDSTIKNRVNSRNTPVIIIMQRLHEEDLCGYIQKQSPGEWTVLSFPCIQDDGTALWTHKHTIEELYKLREDNENVFERQYQQDPKPLKGILFRRDIIKRFTWNEFYKESKGKDSQGKEISLIQRRLGYVDPAEGGNDHLAHINGEVVINGATGKVFITGIIFSQQTVDVTVPQCAKLISKSDRTRVEKNGLGSGFIRDLWKIVSPSSKVLPSITTKKKGPRIWDEVGCINRYFYFLADGEYENGGEYDRFLRQLFSYTKTGEDQPDDAPDATAGLSRFIQQSPDIARYFPIE